MKSLEIRFRLGGWTKLLPNGVGAWLTYPGVLLGGLGFHIALGLAGLPPRASAYATVALGAIAVACLERIAPARARWKPSSSDLWTDLAYLALVQGVLPLALTLAASSAVASVTARFGLGRPWPHAAPIAVQVLLMLLVADFLRYWLHVASHRSPLLWRLHEVHHAPPKLYWLNVGRFHPFEKTLQYLLDALPFALLGVSEDVLALYFVFYALNGFLQHANVDVRLGALNYLVSGPELHRWHHSRQPQESAANYGNNLIVWDLLFGTRFLPKGEVVKSVGIASAGPGRDALGSLFRAHMALIGLTSWRRFRHAAASPREEQLRVLRAILAQNRGTRFGLEHGFAEIASIEDFRRDVPLQSYESLRPYIEAQLEESVPALTAESPVWYARTSGTTDRPKLLPVLRATLRGLARRQLLSAYALYRVSPDAYRGRILAVVSPAVEGELAGGARYGSASGHLYETMPALARRRYVLPAAVFRVGDYELKYLTMLRLALARRDVTLLASANPTTFLKLADTLRRSRRELLADVESETFHRLEELPPDVREEVRSRLGCAEARQAELRLLLENPSVRLRDVWPEVRAVATWTGGSAGFFVERLRGELPDGTLVCELGYLASEVAGTLDVDPRSNLCVPTLRDHFFELVERESYDSGRPVFLTLDGIEEGREYYVVVTTPSGLYRYFMNDIVRAGPRWGATPSLAFVQKGKGVTSLTGEKLTEGQVLEAMRRSTLELGLELTFFVLLADVEEARYRLLVEPASSGPLDLSELASRLDARLVEQNLEYRDKRASGRLGGVEALRLRAGAGEAHKSACLARGQRESQFKFLVLQYAGDFLLDVSGDLLEEVTR